MTDKTGMVSNVNKNSAAEEAEAEATCAVCNDNCDNNNHPYAFHVFLLLIGGTSSTLVGNHFLLCICFCLDLNFDILFVLLLKL